MNRDEALERAKRNEPIEEPRELVFVLEQLKRERVPENTPVWYLVNRMQRLAMDEADSYEAANKRALDSLATVKRALRALQGDDD